MTPIVDPAYDVYMPTPASKEEQEAAMGFVLVHGLPPSSLQLDPRTQQFRFNKPAATEYRVKLLVYLDKVMTPLLPASFTDLSLFSASERNTSAFQRANRCLRWILTEMPDGNNPETA